MKIGVSAKGGSLDAEVEERFGRCPYFVIQDSESDKIEVVANPSAEATGGAGTRAAQALAQHGAEVILTGHVGPNARRALDESGIEVSEGAKGKVRNAVDGYLVANGDRKQGTWSR